MKKRKHLGKHAHVSMKKEYLDECNSDISCIKQILNDQKRRVKFAIKELNWCQNNLANLLEKRKEILSLR